MTDAKAVVKTIPVQEVNGKGVIGTLADTLMGYGSGFFNYMFRNHPKKSAVLSALVLYYLWKRFTTRPKRVTDKVVLITGGGSGIGKNMAKRFARLGARVVLWDVNEGALVAVGKEIADDGGMAWTYVVDVTDKQKIYATAEQVQKEVGKVDILINNAGIVSGNWITDIPDNKVELTFKVNILAHFWTIKAFLPEMVKANSGHIVTIASAAGHGGCAKLTDYCASKFAAVGLDESLRVELARRGLSGVKTTCICPYYINTGMFDGVKTFLSPILPILTEDYASSSIVHAVRCDVPVLMMPRLLYVTPLLRFLLPTSLFDGVSFMLGINNSMDEFKGRK